MKLLLDNTGFQAAGLALARQGRPGSYDTRELLQLATFIIFSDQLVVGGFEATESEARSQEVANHLSHLGVDTDILELPSLSAHTFIDVCHSAARQCAADFEDTFRPDHSSVLGLFPAALTRSTVDSRARKMRELLRKRTSDATISEIAEEGIVQRKTGAVLYMLAASPELREAVRRALKGKRLTRAILDRLDVFCRSYVNDALASNSAALYAPAVARAEIVRRETEYLVGRLTRAVDDIAAELKGAPLGIPSMQSYLIRNGVHPEGVVEAALDVRAATKDLRHDLSRALHIHTELDVPARISIARKIHEVQTLVRQELGLIPAPSLADAIDISIILGIPAPQLSTAKLAAWARNRWKRRRIRVLSDVSKHAAFFAHEEQAYHQLIESCTGGVK